MQSCKSSSTLNIIENVMNMVINRHMSLDQPNIMLANDLNTGMCLLIKLLRIPEMTVSVLYGCGKDLTIFMKKSMLLMLKSLRERLYLP